MKRLIWDEVADIYDRETGGRARTRPMDQVRDWAIGREDLFYVAEDKCICLKEKEKPISIAQDEEDEPDDNLNTHEHNEHCGDA